MYIVIFFTTDIHLQCATVEAGQFFIALPMPPLRWIASTETIRAIMCYLLSSLAHATCAGGGRRG